jgi:D-alanyl-D-alanine carboxypeptidase
VTTRARAGDSPSPSSIRRAQRIQRTQEIQVRTTHRRRKVLTRMGVLAGFALAMVVYPVVGTLTPYSNSAEALPDVVAGEAPSTARAILGGGPQLLSSDLPLPSIDDQASAALTSFEVPASTSLEDCSGSSNASGSNGRLASADLCELWIPGEQLRGDAAVALSALNDHYKSEFGHDLCLSDSYRSLSSQYATKRSRGYLAATPGTSMHGWGLAVDLCSDSARGATKAWLDENAEIYGWGNPSWARSSKYEPWHWEFTSGAANYYDYGY